jgi:hypothetical protein
VSLAEFFEELSELTVAGLKFQFELSEEGESTLLSYVPYLSIVHLQISQREGLEEEIKPSGGNYMTGS